MNKLTLALFATMFSLQTAQAEIFASSYDSGPTYAPRKTTKATKVTKAKKKSKSSGGGNIASCYWQPQPLASGGRFNPKALSAAHKTLPFGTKLEVTNLNNGKKVTVIINDRGPYVKGRVLDLSDRACQVVGVRRSIAPVSFKIVGKASRAEMAALTMKGRTQVASSGGF